jgi:predicted kinase
VEAVIFCGLQGSGKTSYYIQRYLGTHIRISLDVVGTRHREAMLVEACLAAGQRFVVDNTNPTRRDRERYLRPAREAGFRVVACFFDVQPREAIARNTGRAGRARIPVRGILGTYRRLEPPTDEEGFDEVRRIRVAPNGSFVEG